MTVSSLDARNEYVSAAAQTVFNFTFKIFVASDLTVFVTPSGQDSNDATDLTTDYVVDPGSIGVDAGGFFTFNTPLNAGDKVSIVSDIPLDRTVDYQNNGDFRPDTVNGDNDRQVAQIKQLAETVNKSLVFNQSSQNTSGLTIDNPEALKFLRWRADLLGLENVDVSSIDPDLIANDSLVFGFPTLNGAVISTDTTIIKDGASLNIAERTTGNGGGAMWDVVLSSAVTENTFNIVQCTGVATLSLVLRVPAGDIDVKTFGYIADGANGTDNTLVVQAVVDYAEALTFNDGGLSILFTGVGQVESTINIGSDSIHLRGRNGNTDIIYFSGAGNLFDMAGGLNRITDLRMIGNPLTPMTNYAVLSGGNLTMNNARFDDFDRGITWGGGFYHKYYDCRFIDVNYPYHEFNGNNVFMSGCQHTRCIDVITVNGGTGNVTLLGGSFESITGAVARQISGAETSFTIESNYFEVVFRIIVAGKGEHHLINNNIQTVGMFRGVDLSGTDAAVPNSITGSGNKWIVSTDGVNDLQRAYYAAGSNHEMMNVNDSWIKTVTPYTAPYTTVFFLGFQLFDNISGIDALNKIAFSYPWIELTMLNGWVTENAAQNVEPLAYKVQGGVIYIRGRIDGGSATDDSFAQLPAELWDRITDEAYFWYNAGALQGRFRSGSGDLDLPQGNNDVAVNLTIPLRF